jgi:hypothetical protein
VLKKWRLIFCGGSEGGDPIPNDPYERCSPLVNYAKHGCRYAVFGIILALLAPLILLPSSFGFVPVVYSKEFLELSTPAQYLQLLWGNVLIVLKAALKLDYIREVTLPKPPDSALGTASVLAIALLDAAAAFFLITAAVKVSRNLGTWKQQREED